MSTFTTEQLAQLDISDVTKLPVELRVFYMAGWHDASERAQQKIDNLNAECDRLYTAVYSEHQTHQLARAAHRVAALNQYRNWLRDLNTHAVTLEKEIDALHAA